MVSEVIGRETKEQLWYCGGCKTHGSVNYTANSDVMSVVYLIQDDHENVSPTCSTGVMSLRTPVNKKALEQLLREENSPITKSL